jgi:hypothetical protein
VSKQTAAIRRWALIGAEQRLVQLAEEAASIHRTFPELRQGGAGVGNGSSRRPLRAGPELVGGKPVRKKRKLSAAGRKAISDAAKARWAKVKVAKKR